MITSVDSPIDIKHVRGIEPGASALFSADEFHRYGLERDLRPRGQPLMDAIAALMPRRLVAIGMNPSVANAFKPDPTITRELGFARNWGCSLFSKGNLYGWVDPKPVKMWAEHRAGTDIVGPHNDDAIRTMLTMLKRDGGIALACWGKMHSKGDHCLQEARMMAMVRMADEVGVTWQCLGKNKDGSPKHPLYLPASARLESWPR
ncbi:MAG TPA: DUF1643 domain-containing protein [Xanthobacteraceae bacterium]|nr:DUF1643 domain-containing protein [Xanthobacteraceae bacterium]